MVIVGGGINGCALARMAARRGIRTALLEQLDFGAGITSRSTRLIHGGLRYLESFQISLVRESLRDRERLLGEFPGQVAPQPILLPIYAGDSRPPWHLALGLSLYRALAAGGSLPPHRRVSAAETLSLLPGLDSGGLQGSFEYYDCQAVYPERLALEMALQAGEAGAEVRNHTRVTSFLRSGRRVTGVRCDGPDGRREYGARIVVNASGAWVDRVLGLLGRARAEPLLTLVNGAHIVVRHLPGAPRHAVYREARSDGRPFFVVPWRGLYLIGTTETRFRGDPARAAPSERETRYLLREVNGLFPGAALERAAILYSYCGPRPLLRTQSTEVHRASRGHRVVDHERSDGIKGLLSMAGGKLTTAPSFAGEALRLVEAGLGLRPSRNRGRRPAPVAAGVPPRIAGNLRSQSSRTSAVPPIRRGSRPAGCERMPGRPAARSCLRSSAKRRAHWETSCSGAPGWPLIRPARGRGWKRRPRSARLHLGGTRPARHWRFATVGRNSSKRWCRAAGPPRCRLRWPECMTPTLRRKPRPSGSAAPERSFAGWIATIRRPSAPSVTRARGSCWWRRSCRPSARTCASTR